MSARRVQVHAYGLVFVLAATASSAIAADTYDVSTRLFHKGKEFGSPGMVVMSGVPGAVEVSGPNGYRLKLTATGDGHDRIKISTQLDSAHGVIAPEMVVRSGVPATVSVGDLKIAITATPHGS